MAADQPLRTYDSLRMRFRLLERIAATQLFPPEIETAELRVVLTLAEDHPGAECLRLQFHGVRNLVFSQSELSVTDIGLDIEVISDRQWEGLNYAVQETNGALSLLCRSFDVSVEARHGSEGYRVI